MFAHVIVDIKHSAVDQSFDYVIPKEFEAFIKPGMRVLVPFGVQQRMGIITKITADSIHAKKPILTVLDVEPTIDEELSLIIKYLEDKTLETQAQIYETAIPKQLWMTYQKVVVLLDKDKIDESLKPFFNKNNIWPLKSSDYTYFTLLNKMKQQGIVAFKTEVKQKGQTKQQLFAKLIDHDYHPTDAQFETIELLKRHDEMKVTELKEQTGYSLATLIKKGIIKVYEKQVMRTFEHFYELHDKQVILNDEQAKAYQTVSQSLQKNDTFLLEGITGSGKTEIFLKLIEDVLKLRKQALILVPEIMLVGPMAQRIQAKFTDARIAVYHSNLSDGLKYDTYSQSKNDEIDIFLPLNHFGIIIIDEEHDSSYIQQESVYYDTRELAQIKAEFQKFPVVLSSATPSIVSQYKTQQKVYTHIRLNKRALVFNMPKVSIMDMREELKNGNLTILSKDLKTAIDQALAKNEQIMLLMNQKGYAPFVMCRSCGYVPKDPESQNSLTYYKQEGKLKSKYSAYEESFSPICPSCGRKTLKEVGVGIEYVHEQLTKLYPEQRILRMDADTTKARGAHEKLWLSFLNQEANILVGTQMIAKGLDFPKLTVVGILMAEAQLKVPTYDANEKAFMLFTQALGRAGRHVPGSVFIQTYDPEHYGIQTAAKHEYKTFYKQALTMRKYSSIKPFGYMHQLVISGPEYLKTYQYAFSIKKLLEQHGFTILGPKPSVILKRHDQYRFIITIKYQQIKQNENLIKLLKTIESQTIRTQFYYEPNEI